MINEMEIKAKEAMEEILRDKMNELTSYGQIVTDDKDLVGNTRVKTILYNDKIYLLIMCNGRVINIYDAKEETV